MYFYLFFYVFGQTALEDCQLLLRHLSSWDRRPLKTVTNTAFDVLIIVNSRQTIGFSLLSANGVYDDERVFEAFLNSPRPLRVHE